MPKEYSNLRIADRHHNTHNRVGEVYGMLTVVDFAGYIGKHAAWWVECECGTNFIRRDSSLVHYGDYKAKRNPQNCGCLRVNLAEKYGKSLYNIHNKLKLKGILCPEWGDFEAFAQGVGKRQGRSLRRSDESRPMGPDNFIWANEKHHGVGEASERLGITKQGLYYRLKHQSLEKALTCPKRTRKQPA